MKKTLLIIGVIFIITISFLVGLLYKAQEQTNKAKQINSEYEKYLNKQIYGTELVSIINKTINTNEENNIQKDNNYYYINNGQTSIKIDLKMITVDKTYPMEEIYNNGLENFIMNFNLILFKISKIEYHESTGRISRIIFEQLEE